MFEAKKKLEMEKKFYSIFTESLKDLCEHETGLKNMHTSLTDYMALMSNTFAHISHTHHLTKTSIGVTPLGNSLSMAILGYKDD